MTKIIHQIFLKISDKSMEDFNYHINSKLWEEWCEKNDYKYILHNKESIDELMVEKDKIMSKRKDDDNKLAFIDIDWGKYIVLNHYGGVYIDLDVKPTDKSLEYLQRPYPIIGSWYRPSIKKNEINNNLIAFEKGELRDLLDYCYNEYEIKSKMEIYDKWKCRFLTQVAGPKVFARWCKKTKLNFTFHEDFNECFVDQETLSWLPEIKKKVKHI